MCPFPLLLVLLCEAFPAVNAYAWPQLRPRRVRATADGDRYPILGVIDVVRRPEGSGEGAAIKVLPQFRSRANRDDGAVGCAAGTP